jgi:hypothetical protein
MQEKAEREAQQKKAAGAEDPFAPPPAPPRLEVRATRRDGSAPFSTPCVLPPQRRRAATPRMASVHLPHVLLTKPCLLQSSLVLAAVM